MRIAYLLAFRGGRETGVYRKVAEQAGEWRRLGAEVALFVATGKTDVDDWAALLSAERVVALPSHPLATMKAKESLLRSVRRWSPDIVYSRHGLVHPGMLWTALRTIMVLEVNSNDVTEYRASSPWRWRYARFTRATLLRRTAGLVFVTDEIARIKEFADSRAPSTTVANGIRLSDYPPYPRPQNVVPRLVFIGHPRSPWHGIEHLLLLARSFPEWAFDVIGPGASELSDRPGNVAAHGTLVPEQYDSLLRRADIAVGTLGLYKNEMNEACPLKTREYLARGLPTIIGYHDTDFPEPTSFLMQVPNRPDGVASSLAQIADFVERSRTVKIPRTSIEHLDVGSKERARIEFLENALSGFGQRRTLRSDRS